MDNQSKMTTGAPPPVKYIIAPYTGQTIHPTALDVLVSNPMATPLLTHVYPVPGDTASNQINAQFTLMASYLEDSNRIRQELAISEGRFNFAAHEYLRMLQEARLPPNKAPPPPKPVPVSPPPTGSHGFIESGHGASNRIGAGETATATAACIA